MNDRNKKLSEQDLSATAIAKPIAKSREDGETWRVNLGKYLIDISKYVITGVMIASMFKDIENKVFMYLLSFIIGLSALIVGLVLTNIKKKE